jgi:hypothetical protein
MGQSYVNLSQVIQTTQIYLKTLQDLKKNLKLHIKFAQVTCTCIRISSFTADTHRCHKLRQTLCLCHDILRYAELLDTSTWQKLCHWKAKSVKEPHKNI